MRHQIIRPGLKQPDINETDASLVDVQVANSPLPVGHSGNAVDIGNHHRGLLVFRRKQRPRFIVNRTFYARQDQQIAGYDCRNIENQPDNLPEHKL